VVRELTLDQIYMYAVGGNPDEWRNQPELMDPAQFKAQLLAQMEAEGKPLPKPVNKRKGRKRV